MDSDFRGRGDLSPRHELDRLSPTSAISAGPATNRQLADLVAIARREIPGVSVSEAGLAQFLRSDPESIFAFERAGRLLGGIAFLYLNCRGYDALLLDGIDLKNPSHEFLARPDEEVSAIYVWALACHGRAVVGLANVAGYLRKPRFISADYFAQPSTTAGRNLTIAIGFERIPSHQRELWRYQRPWNRVSKKIPASTISAGSFEDARRWSLHFFGQRPNRASFSVRIARDPNDLMLVTAIRSAVYLAEQDCPIEEEFDGNDLVAAHFLGFVGERACGLSARALFGEFAKVERLAVRHQYRRSRLSFKLVQASVDYDVKRKGFKKVYGQAQDRLVDFWAHFGARPSATTARSPFPISPTPRWFLISSPAPMPSRSIAIPM